MFINVDFTAVANLEKLTEPSNVSPSSVRNGRMWVVRVLTS